jgi:hypothetical protein
LTLITRSQRDTGPGQLGRACTVTIPWTSPVLAAVKGVIHVPAHNTRCSRGARRTLVAIAGSAPGS